MSRHLKAYNAPKSWTIPRKTTKWVIRPAAGAQPLEGALPIALLLKQTGCAQTSRETRKILNDKAVTVDGKVVKDGHFGVGFMDSIHIKPNIHLRGTLDAKGRLQFIPVPEAELSKKICKITGKHVLKGGKIQLNLSHSRNILAEKDTYATGDSLLIELPSQKIAGHFPLAKGSTVFLTSGKHTGLVGTVDDIQGARIWCTQGKEKIETLKKFAFVIGKDKPAVKL